MADLVCMVPPRGERERRMEKLALELPSTVHLPGARAPFMPRLLDHLLASEPGQFSPAELATGRWLLAIWNRSATWRSGRFDALQALSVWDAEHRAVFARWAAKPWGIYEAYPQGFQAEVFPLR
jgi:hypothetical protein